MDWIAQFEFINWNVQKRFDFIQLIRQICCSHRSWRSDFRSENDKKCKNVSFFGSLNFEISKMGKLAKQEP